MQEPYFQRSSLMHNFKTKNPAHPGNRGIPKGQSLIQTTQVIIAIISITIRTTFVGCNRWLNPKDPEGRNIFGREVLRQHW